MITVPQPPDFYFIDGKSVTQRKFKKTKNEIPNSIEIILYNDDDKKAITDQYCGDLYLLYSTIN